MSIHAWVDIDLRMDVLVHDVDIQQPSTGLTGIGMLKIKGSPEHENDFKNVFLSRGDTGSISLSGKLPKRTQAS